MRISSILWEWSESMGVNLEIADAIENNQLVKAYDEFCKKILSNKQILAWIMKECVSEYKEIPLEKIPSYIENDPLLNVSMDEDFDKIQGLNVEDRSVYGAEIKYDILFDAKLPNSAENEKIGLFINIEAQNNSNTSYPLLSRAVYYCSRLLAKQKNMQGGFTNSDFKNLKKVYSIWIVMNSAKRTEGVLNKYVIKEECLKTKYHFPKSDYDKLSIVMIYPNSEYDIHDDEYSLMEMLYILFKANLSPQDKKYQLKENYGIMMSREIDKEVEDMCNLSQGILNEGRNKGLIEGRAEGLVEGRAEGLVEGQIEGQTSIVVHMMKTTNQSMNEVMDMLGIDEAIRPEIKKAIQAKNLAI